MEQQKKYEFTGETKNWRGITLHRIRAVRDFTLKSGIKVAQGDLGGWIEKEENLSHKGSAWVSGGAKVYGNAQVSGDAWVYADAQVRENARVYGDAQVFGDARVYGDAEVYGNALVFGNAGVYGNASVGDNAQVFGNALVFGNAKVYGAAVVYDNAKVCDNAEVSGDARVYGNATVVCDAKVEKSSDVIWFKNNWSSGRTFTYTRSNGKWRVGCFYGTGEELIKKAYADSETSGRCYEAIVRATEEIYEAISDREANVS